MERSLLYKEVSSLETVNYEASFADKINSFFKNTAVKFPLMFIQLLLSNEKRENYLTNIVFFDRHPELKNRKLAKHEKKLIKEWQSIRKIIVRPVLQYIYGERSDITKLESNELFADILRFTESWIEAYIIALDNFKFITERATAAELKELKGVSGKFLFEIAREAIDVIGEFAENNPLVKAAKVIGSIGSIINRYNEREEQYQSLKNKDALISFVVSEKELISDLKLELNKNFRDLAGLYVPMMKKDKFIRAKFEDIYRRSKNLSTSNQNEIFKKVSEKWAQQFPKSYLVIIYNSDYKIISIAFTGLPFGEQILSKLRSYPIGLNLETFMVNRLVKFYPNSKNIPAVPRPFELYNPETNIRYEFVVTLNGEKSIINGPLNTRFGYTSVIQAFDTHENKLKAQKVYNLPLPIVKS